jgi:AcrR family transcriptional regulator
MPKTTFLNLEDNKRRTIEHAATREFAAYGFYGARLNRIVEASGNAKGSFYQYFENLGDLYLHLLEQISEQNLAAIHETLANHEDADLFAKLLNG